MNAVEAEGRTIEEAVAVALRQLGVEREQVEIDILSQSTKGFLGIGGKKARVRASLRKPLIAPESAPARNPTAPQKEQKEQKERPVAPAGRKSPAQPPAASRHEPRVAPAVAQEIYRPSTAMREAAHGSVPESPHQQKADAELPSPELVKRACDVLRDILGQMGMPMPVSSQVRDDEVLINLEDTSGGLVIGRKGETLDALEYLLNRIITRGDENEAHLLLDASGYRERRQHNLESLALRLGERAKRRRRTVTLSPLNPRDRRIVHLTLEGDPLVTTQSMGRGYLRRLSIVPEGGPRRERSRDRNAA